MTSKTVPPQTPQATGRLSVAVTPHLTHIEIGCDFARSSATASASADRGVRGVLRHEPLHRVVDHGVRDDRSAPFDREAQDPRARDALDRAAERASSVLRPRASSGCSLRPLTSSCGTSRRVVSRMSQGQARSRFSALLPRPVSVAGLCTPMRPDDEQPRVRSFARGPGPSGTPCRRGAS